MHFPQQNAIQIGFVAVTYHINQVIFVVNPIGLPPKPLINLLEPEIFHKLFMFINLVNKQTGFTVENTTPYRKIHYPLSKTIELGMPRCKLFSRGRRYFPFKRIHLPLETRFLFFMNVLKMFRIIRYFLEKHKNYFLVSEFLDAPNCLFISFK
jgi:hypothetical protein